MKIQDWFAALGVLFLLLSGGCNDKDKKGGLQDRQGKEEQALRRYQMVLEAMGKAGFGGSALADIYMSLADVLTYRGHMAYKRALKDKAHPELSFAGLYRTQLKKMCEEKIILWNRCSPWR